MERKQPSVTVGTSATLRAPARAVRGRHGMRFVGALLLFLGILAAVGILTALMVFLDPMAVPRGELLGGRLIILGAVAAAGTFLLAVVAPRAGYHWFAGPLFLVPIYGQAVFLPRVLWRATRSKAGWPGTEPRSKERAYLRPNPGTEPETPRDPGSSREDARALAALLSGRGSITLPDVEPRIRPAGDVIRREAVRPPTEVAPAETVVPGEPAEEPVEGTEAGFHPEAPARSSEPPAHPNRRYLMATALVLLILWLVAVPLVGAWQLQSERSRSDRLVTESAELRSQVAELRTQVSVLRSEMGLLREQLESLRDELQAVQRARR